MRRIADIDCRRMARFVALLAAMLYGVPAGAELDSVSGVPNPLVDANALTAVPAAGDPAQVAISLANGFPLWYQDTTGLKLELCLEQTVTNAATDLPVIPCLTAEPITTNPISFPSNFGPEAFYWAVEAATTFTSSTGGGDALLVLGQEAAFLNDLPNEGDQIVFGRTRIRINVPVAGTYRVTYPFGTRDFVVDAVAAGRDINQTQDIGILAARDFLASLNDGPVPADPPAPTTPFIDAGIVNLTGRSIGPFLEGAPLARVFDVSGNQYLAEPGTELAPVLRPIQTGPEILVDGVPTNVNYFEITLLNPSADFILDAAGIDGLADNTVRITEFMLMGKVFNDAPNLPPVALPDRAATTRGVPVVIDVTANDTDLVAIDSADPFNPGNPLNTNVHGINPNALGIVAGNQIVRSSPLTVAGGSRVQRTTDLASGKSFLIFSPLNNALAVGEHTFSYVIQDKGGLISAPATVTVTVEDLAIDSAEYRPRTGKWRIGGTSSDVTDNTVTLHGGTRATLTGAAEVPAVVTDAAGNATLRISGSSIDLQLTVAPLPASAITAVHIHVGGEGAEGPAIFNLFNQGVFPGTLNRTLTGSDVVLQPAEGVTSFSAAVAAILAGNAYINVHTVANPDGEIRGQLRSPLIGSAVVGPDGSWAFSGKSTASPGPPTHVSATSANGITTGVPLKLR